MDDFKCDKEGHAVKHVSSLCKHVKIRARNRKPTEKAKAALQVPKTYKHERKK